MSGSRWVVTRHPENTVGPTFIQCWGNAGPPSTSLAQHYTGIVLSSRRVPLVTHVTTSPVSTSQLMLAAQPQTVSVTNLSLIFIKSSLAKKNRISWFYFPWSRRRPLCKKVQVESTSKLYHMPLTSPSLPKVTCGIRSIHGDIAI